MLVDAIGVRPGSAAIVIENVLRGWTQVAPDDALVVLVDGEARFGVPDSARVVSLLDGDGSVLRRLWAQSVGVRRACRAENADALLSAISASSFLGGGCPSGTIVYDLRHEVRPEEFSPARRWARKVLYGWSFRRADHLFCISERTRDDLVRTRPRLAGKAQATLLGADHVATWRPAADDRTRYVLAFGHFANKNVDAVVRGWAAASARQHGLVLRVCGLGSGARKELESLVAEVGVADSVELLGWLTDAEFEATFAGATAILFPSAFEGFGLPAVEALRLGIPVVVSSDPALLEVTDGHAVVAAGGRPTDLAAALDLALSRTADDLAAGIAHAETFTWAGTAGQMRSALDPVGGFPT